MAVIGSKRSAEAAAETVQQREVKVLSCTDIDAELLVVKDRGHNKNGPVLIASYNGDRLAVNLTPGKEWLRAPFGLERNSKFAKDEAANGGDGDFETIPINLDMPEFTDGEIAARKAIMEIDASAKKQVQAIMPSIQWHDALRKSDGYDDRLAPKVVVKAKDLSECTTFHVRPHGKDSVKGRGTDFIKPLLDAHRSFRQAKVKVAIVLHKIWVNGGKAGILWRVATLVADLPQKQEIVYQDVFGDNVFDEQ